MDRAYKISLCFPVQLVTFQLMMTGFSLSRVPALCDVLVVRFFTILKYILGLTCLIYSCHCCCFCPTNFEGQFDTGAPLMVV